MVRQLSHTGEAGTSACCEGEAAQRIIDGLIAYARLGIGRPPGALTPAEARSVVHTLTRSEDLASQAAALVARCDGCLFSERRTDHDAEQLVASPRTLQSSRAHLGFKDAGGIDQRIASSCERVTAVL